MAEQCHETVRRELNLVLSADAPDQSSLQPSDMRHVTDEHHVAPLPD